MELKDLVEPITELTPKTIGGLKVRSVTEVSPYVNILVYGDPGIGKTRLAGSASLIPEMSPVLLIDVEGGTMSLADDFPDVDVVRVTTWDDMNSVYSELYDNPNLYKTVILDSITEMQKFSMDEIMRDAVKKNPERDPEVPGMREWGINGEQIRLLVRAFRDLHMNVILTALSKEDKDERTGITKTKPSLTGKLKDEVAGFMDIVSYMYKKRVKVEGSTERRLGTFLLSEGTDQYVAKDRSGKLPSILEDPTMSTIYNSITGSKKTNK